MAAGLLFHPRRGLVSYMEMNLTYVPNLCEKDSKYFKQVLIAPIVSFSCRIRHEFFTTHLIFPLRSNLSSPISRNITNMLPSGILSFAVLCLTFGSNAQATSPIEILKRNDSNPGDCKFRDDFNKFDTNNWKCEYTCPVIESSKATFRLSAGIEPNKQGSWSKAGYKGKLFSSGVFRWSFSLTGRPPKDQPVWWGVALWNESNDGFDEINIGMTTDDRRSNTYLRVESTKKSDGVSIPLNVDVDLYDGKYHTAKIDYTSKRIKYYFDGKLIHTVTDKTKIPTNGMELILGPRLVDGAEPLINDFTQKVDWVEITQSSCN